MAVKEDWLGLYGLQPLSSCFQSPDAQFALLKRYIDDYTILLLNASNKDVQCAAGLVFDALRCSCFRFADLVFIAPRSVAFLWPEDCFANYTFVILPPLSVNIRYAVGIPAHIDNVAILEIEAQATCTLLMEIRCIVLGLCVLTHRAEMRQFATRLPVELQPAILTVHMNVSNARQCTFPHLIGLLQKSRRPCH